MMAAQLMADAAAYVGVVQEGERRNADMMNYVKDRLGEQKEKRNSIMKSIEDMMLNGKLKCNRLFAFK